MDPVSKAQAESSSQNRRSLENLKRGKRFQPGVSGNPGGRPKKSHVTKMYERLLANPKKRKEIEDAVFSRLISDRMVGALELRECADRTEGRVTQEMDVNITGTLALAETIQERRKRKSGDGNSDIQP